MRNSAALQKIAGPLGDAATKATRRISPDLAKAVSSVRYNLKVFEDFFAQKAVKDLKIFKKNKADSLNIVMDIADVPESLQHASSSEHFRYHSRSRGVEFANGAYPMLWLLSWAYSSTKALCWKHAVEFDIPNVSHTVEHEKAGAAVLVLPFGPQRSPVLA